MTATSQDAQIDIRPTVGTRLWNAGEVVEHSRVIDSLGRFHGLIRLVIYGAGENNIEAWTGMLLTGAVVKMAAIDPEVSSRLIILYKFEPDAQTEEQ